LPRTSEADKAHGMDNVVVTLRAPRESRPRVNKTRLGRQYGVSARTIGRWIDEQGWRPGTPPPPGAKSAAIPESNQREPTSADCAPTLRPHRRGKLWWFELVLIVQLCVGSVIGLDVIMRYYHQLMASGLVRL
jgi:hypothetical protein